MVEANATLADGTRPTASAAASAARGQPAGLYLVSFAQFWERFSFYGILGLLALYLTAGSAADGLGWDESAAVKLVGFYGAACFIAPAFGGWVASRWWGDQRCILIGSATVAIGHVLLSIQALPGLDRQMQSPLFVIALGVIAIGTGLLKPATSSIVGRLYLAGEDARRDRGFTIFMVGIYGGSFLANFIAGTLGERVGWHWGFGAAAIGMAISLVVYVALARRLLGDTGRLPDHSRLAEIADFAPPPRRATASILVFSFFTILYASFFFQDAGMLNLLAERRIDREIGGFLVPATWFLSVPTLVFMALAPLATGLRARRIRDVHREQAFALALMGGAYALLWWGASTPGLISPWWLIAAYTLFGFADLHVWPVQLDEVTRLAPPSRASLYVGLWWVAGGTGIFLTGYIAGLADMLGGTAPLLLAISLASFALSLLARAAGRIVRIRHPAI